MLLPYIRASGSAGAGSEEVPCPALPVPTLARAARVSARERVRGCFLFRVYPNPSNASIAAFLFDSPATTDARCGLVRGVFVSTRTTAATSAMDSLTTTNNTLGFYPIGFRLTESTFFFYLAVAGREQKWAPPAPR